jgi:uncharacterized protein YukE
MADCRIVNQAVADAVKDINQIASEYDQAGNSLITSITNALAEMQGAAKDSLFENFIDTALKSFVQGMEEGAQSLPATLKGMASLLEANRTNFIEVDSNIATSISGGK